MKTEILEGGYSIKIPASINIAQASKIEDFLLYKLSDIKGKLLLTIYLGNAPQLAKYPVDKAIISSENIGGFPATFIRWPSKDGLLNGDINIQIQQSGWPSVAHIFFSDLSQTEVAIIDKIISSFSENTQEK